MSNNAKHKRSEKPQRLGIIDLLSLRGFDPSIPGKLVRHQDSRYDLAVLAKHGWLEAYQRYQTRPVFHRCDQIVSFVGAESTKARLFGVFRMLGCRPAASVPVPAGCPYPEWSSDSKHCYELRREPGYADLENRVVIEWGKGALSWHQHLSNKEILEILPSGQVKPPFRDYLEFVLTHEELEAICGNPDAHREWRARLSAVAGVYLIVATTTGAQYVGSAYGEGGIWSRWMQYAKNGHGGNALLRKLVADDPNYPSAFAFSILQVLPKTQAQSEVLAREKQYKEKLGKRAVSLNLN
jgi:hypothetical protein